MRSDPTTLDGLLDGRVRFSQPTDGYRVAMDAVMLAAAVPAIAVSGGGRERKVEEARMIVDRLDRIDESFRLRVGARYKVVDGEYFVEQLDAEGETE